MRISDDLALNVMRDFQKSEVSAEDRSAFIRSYLEEHNLSARALAKELGVSHSTMHDWVSLRQKNRAKYDKVVWSVRVSRGYTPVVEACQLLNRLVFVVSKDGFVRNEKFDFLLSELNRLLD